MLRQSRLLLLAIAVVTVAAGIGITVGLVSSGPSAFGQEQGASGAIPHKHFTRIGWATNCSFVSTQSIDGATYDMYGGLPGSSRQGPIAGTPHPGSSCLRAPLDHSIYSSAQMTIGGLPQQAKAVFAYYLAPKHVPLADAKPFPPGLHMTGTQVQFSCAHGGSPRTQAPYDCRPHFPAQPEVDVWVTFPQCWDGSGTQPNDVRYADASGCPSGFPVVIPEVQLQFTWSTPDGTGATFSTGAFQAQWTNGWDPRALDSLVTNCIETPTPCGSIINYFHRSPLPPASS